jgi:molybdate transport system substrate-binding protein
MKKSDRRKFLKSSGAALLGSIAFGSLKAGNISSTSFQDSKLKVWSCGGLAEALEPANKRFEEIHGVSINYSGAFAAALGKSLFGGAETEVFAPRVLELAQKLKAQGLMLNYQPLCYTKYVLITPLGNPANIQSIKDLSRPGVRISLSPKASPPGGKATMGIMKKSGIIKDAQKNIVYKGDCVQMDVSKIIDGKADVGIVEQRIIYLPNVKGKVEVLNIPEEFIPAIPVPFTIGIMKYAKDMNLAKAYVDFITSEEGQVYFDLGIVMK